MRSFVRSRLVRKIDPKATKLSAVSARMPTLAAIPIDFETDREILDTALALIELTPPEKVRIVWIRNTANMREMECSEVFLEEVRHWKDLSVLSGLLPLDSTLTAIYATTSPETSFRQNMIARLGRL
jgi:hypothetical protein